MSPRAKKKPAGVSRKPASRAATARPVAKQPGAAAPATGATTVARRPAANGRRSPTAAPTGAPAPVATPPATAPIGSPAPNSTRPAALVPAYAELPDAELVRLAQAGDRRAFDELVKRYRDKVYRLAFKILRHEEDAAEALQDAFLSAFRGLKNFKAESTFSTWLYRITTNAALMKYRKRRDNVVSLEQSQSRNEDAEPIDVPDWTTQPVDELLSSELREVMNEARDRLPEELRTVFVLRDEDERSNAEVAEMLDLSVAAVKSRLHRARLSLRDRLNRYFADRTTRKERPR